MNSGFNGDKPLPYSEDAEKGVLCSLKHSPDEVASLCTERVRPEYFLNPAHKLVYGLFLEFIDAKKPLDFPLVKKALMDQLKDLVDDVPQFLTGSIRLLTLAQMPAGTLTSFWRHGAITEAWC